MISPVLERKEHAFDGKLLDTDLLSCEVLPWVMGDLSDYN